MRYFISLVSLLLLVCTSCKTQKNTSMTDFSIQKEWQLVRLEGKQIDVASLPAKPTLSFDLGEQKIYGSASCNRYFGFYKMEGPNKISFSKIGATLKYCFKMNVETSMLSLLEKVEQYQLQDGLLTLTDAKGTSLLQFKPL